ncbi:MAG: phosphatidate cytidylyltransferase [Planctomycetota bacterium]
MLKYRLITGPLLIAALLFLVWLDDRVETVELSDAMSRMFAGRDNPPGGLVIFILGLVVAPLAAKELSAIFRAQGIMTRTWLTAAAAMAGLVVSYSVPIGTDAVTAIAIVSTAMCGVFVASLLLFSRHRNVEGVVAAAGAVMFTMVYLGLMTGFLLALRRQHSAWWIVGVLLVTKSCDTGAYFTGRAIGRHKMIPWLSPGKTWEGLMGGVILAMITGAVAAWASSQWLSPVDHVPVQVGVLAGIVFGLVGQFGDLTMSLLKRGAGIKDSSRLLPGLGGVLDVLDSPLMVAPVAFWLLEFGTSTTP